MIILDKKTQERISTFNRYAQLVGEKLGVTVVFDGAEAHTDGKVITLPNIAGMSEYETEFLYCVLLHEVGHIRHSTFTVEDFKKIRTKNHFHIANSIEDARIENLLIKEFDGANNIFEDLYNDFATDASLWKKIFGFDPGESTPFYTLSAYIHYHLLKIKNKLPFEKLLGAKALSKVQPFIDAHQIENMIDSHPLNSWDDVVLLANKIYELFFSHSKDKSETISLEDMETSVNEIKDIPLKNLEDNLKKYNEDLIKLSNDIKFIRQDIVKMSAEIESKVSALDEECEKLNLINDNLDNIADYRRKISNKTESLQSAKDRITKKEQKIKENEEKLKTLESLTVKSEKVDERINKVKERLDKDKSSLKDLSTKTDDKQTKANELVEEFNKLSEPVKELTNEQIQELKNQNDAKIEQLEKQLNEMRAPVDKKIASLRENQFQQRTLREEMEKKNNQLIRQIQSDLEEAGIPISFLPEFQETPGWDEADGVQRDFDDSASRLSGQIVVNGAKVINGNRDVALLIDKVKRELSSIDLAKVFKEKQNVSRFDSLNEMSEINNTINSDSETFESNRNHIPLTTQFDAVKLQCHSDGNEVKALRLQHKDFINKLKGIFLHKLKFEKKNKFKGNQEEGLIDSRSLWKLASKQDEGFYEVAVPKFINKVSASIALDLSGSMDKDYTEHGQKLKEISLAISDALTSVFVRHEIAGYHAPVSHEMRAIESSPAYNRSSNKLETIIYKSFNDRANNGIQNIELHCSDNSDGESLKVIGGRLLKERARRKVMFIITDGKPFLSNSDISVLDQDLKNSILWLKRNKVEIISIGFNEQGQAFYGEDFCLAKDSSDLLNFFKKKL